MGVLKRLLRRFKDKCGAATVEALISFTGFLFVMVTVLNVANYCRAQMIISNAVDSAAREMSQYAYFYDMSGMTKLNKYVNENAEIGAANINDVVDGVHSVYATMSGAITNAEETGHMLADKVDNQSLNYEDIQAAFMGLSSDVNSINSSIASMEAKLDAVGNNPLLYMKSIAAVAGSKGLEVAQTYMLAAPLAKKFTEANIDSGKLTVDEYLEKIGVKDGLDGLNFKTSTIFTGSQADEIHIRCYYRLSLCNFLDKELFEIPICKESITCAWLGGDDNPVKVCEQAAVPAPMDRSLAQADAEDDNTREELNSEALGDNSDEDYVDLIKSIDDPEELEEVTGIEDAADLPIEEVEEAYILGGPDLVESGEVKRPHKYYDSYEEYLADFEISPEEAKKMLNEDGTFVNPKYEEKYQEYVKRKTKNGEEPRDRIDWKIASGYSTEYSKMARGNHFNDTAGKNYKYNEVTVKVGDKNYRVDSYDPVKKEIISRKATDLDQIDEATYRGYLAEIQKKYAVGTEITSHKFDDKDPETDDPAYFKLEGSYILEIPASNEKLENIDYYKKIAEEYNVTLRFTEEYPDSNNN
ncbi:MAG: pilus assembly protein [Lachnospiraceae bacterium]|nr:pilus assembly protein [Lachnospiraceae bacterium]